MKKFAVVACIALMVLATAIAAYGLGENSREAGYGGYTGETARARRGYDPLSREQYFGTDYIREFTNFGSKGPTSRIQLTGAKSAYSGVFNLDTNSFVNRGRDPSRISNWDPNVKGQSRLDVSVDLLPYDPVDLQLANQALYTKGTMRIVSEGQAYGSGQNTAEPRTRILVQTRGMEPRGQDKFYEVWLVDDETEYALSIGLIKSGIQNTGQLSFEMNRMVDMFEAVMVTAEPYVDNTPGPDGDIVLYGRIDEARVSTLPLGSEANLRYR